MHENPAWRPDVTVATVVARDERLLFVEEHAGGRRVLNQPAGHLEDGETLVDAAVRETLEETAWHVQPEALVGVYLWRNPANGRSFLRVAFAAVALEQDTGRELDEGIIRALWLEPAQLRAQAHRLRSPMVTRCMDDFLAGRRYPLEVLNSVGILPEAQAGHQRAG